MSLLDKMKAAAEKTSGGGKTEWIKLKDKEQVRVRFLQEIDENSPSYDEKFGLAHLAYVHSSPANYKLKAECTAESGECYGCESVDGPEDEAWRWKPKAAFYVNVLVTDANGTSVKVLNQGMSDKHIVTSLLEFASEYGSITDRDYKLKRVGAEMNNTSYILTPLDKGPMPLVEGELVDLTKLVRHVDYAAQEAFYSGKAESQSNDSDGW